VNLPLHVNYASLSKISTSIIVVFAEGPDRHINTVPPLRTGTSCITLFGARVHGGALKKSSRRLSQTLIAWLVFNQRSSLLLMTSRYSLVRYQ
jgi:hypothetical protein